MKVDKNTFCPDFLPEGFCAGGTRQGARHRELRDPEVPHIRLLTFIDFSLVIGNNELNVLLSNSTL